MPKIWFDHQSSAPAPPAAIHCCATSQPPWLTRNYRLSLFAHHRRQWKPVFEATWERLRLEPLKGATVYLRWFGHLVRMPLDRLPREVFDACPTGRRRRDHMEGLPRLSGLETSPRIPQEFTNAALERKVWSSLVELVPPWPDYGSLVEYVGWMDGWMVWKDKVKCACMQRV